MAWIVLILSGSREAVWATALGRSEGFSRLVPSVVQERSESSAEDSPRGCNWR